MMTPVGEAFLKDDRLSMAPRISRDRDAADHLDTLLKSDPFR
jgi:hypothetical protein